MKSVFLQLTSLSCLILFNLNIAIGQEIQLSSDELFEQARNEAFNQKNYEAAVLLSKKALVQTPEYTDICIFLGRLYTWMDKIDSARIVFRGLEEKKSENEDFYFAYGSLEYWENQNIEALRIVNKGISINPNSTDLLLLKSKILSATKQYKLAEQTLEKLLTVDPKNTGAYDLRNSIKEQTIGNEVGINYNWMKFNKQFQNDWHILSVSYKRKTSIGSFIFKTNLANKFATNGAQFELEAYPRLSKIFYLYLGTGYSASSSIFPRFRTGASLYANLPASFEAEVGYRQLKFTENVWMYTASIGKYYKNLWFNARTYLTPREGNISHSYAGTVRYYISGGSDYLGFILGTGISPEENRENLFNEKGYKLKTFKTGLEYNYTYKSKNIFEISTTYYNVEFQPKTKDNQFDVSIGYKRKF